MSLVRQTGPALWWSVAKDVYAQIDGQNLSLIAAGVAFFSMLAMFPGLAALIALFGLWADPVVIQEQIALLQGIIPDDILALVDGQLNRLTSAGATTLGWATALSILLALWSARAGVGAMMRGMNTIYHSPNRSFLRHYFAAFVLTLSLVSVAFVAGAAVVIAPLALAVLPIADQTAQIIDLVRWSAAIFVIAAGISLLYRYGPRKRGDRRAGWITPGAGFAVIIWAGASAAFSEYLANFGNYNEVYGSIGAVVALLMWLYLSAFLVLLGAALNAQLERRAFAADPLQDAG